MEKKYIDMREWMGLPQEERALLSVAFNMPRSGHTHVQSGVNGSTVISDGHTFTDLESISIDLMRSFLLADNSETDFYKLFDKVLKKLKGEETKVESTPEVTEEIKKDVKPRTKKKQD